MFLLRWALAAPGLEIAGDPDLQCFRAKDDWGDVAIQMGCLDVKFHGRLLPGIVPKNPYIGCHFEGRAVRISTDKVGKVQKI